MQTNRKRPKQTVSKQFLISLKLHEQPAYKLAQKAGINPTILSKLIHGIQPLKWGDNRILRVAAVLGLQPDEAFAPEVEDKEILNDPSNPMR